MKYFISLVLIIALNSTVMMAQQLDYYPEQREGVSDKQYQYACMILEETYKGVRKDNGVYNYVDYWNLAMAYIILKEPRDQFRTFFFKSKEMNPKNFAQIFLSPDFGGKDASKWEGYLSQSEHEGLLAEARQIAATANQSSTKPKPETKQQIYSKYNQDLVDVFERLQEKDRRHRVAPNKDKQKQRILDDENLAEIDTYYEIYKRYIGKSLVGEAYKNVMWSVVQHSNLEAMEKYLPCICNAVKTKELKSGQLQLLIDRVYAIKYDYQVYGTQAGFPLGSERQIGEAKKQYENCFSKENPYKNFLRKN